MKIPGYKLLELLATGGTASVYLGVQKSLNRKVAIKVLDKLESGDQSERFLFEGSIIASLNHRNIITVHDIGKVRNYHYIAMEHMEGGSLADKIRRGMTIRQVLNVMTSIGESLHYVHDKGIIHRDIKPGNILFHKDGRAKLGDFGIAKRLDTDQEDTLEGYALGSPYYVSPELVLGNPLDHRTDLYGLGVVFFEMLTGMKPYMESNHVQTMVAHVEKPIPQLPEKFRHYQDFLNKLMAKSPTHRFSSTKAMIQELKGLSRSKPKTRSTKFFPIWISSPAETNYSFSKVATASAAIVALGALALNETNWISLPFEPNVVPSHTTDFSLARLKKDSPYFPQSNAYASLDLSTSSQLLGSVITRSKSAEERPTIVDQGNQLSSYIPTQDSAQTPFGIVEKMSLKELLASAKAAMKEFRLTRPSGLSSYDYYQRALALDSSNQEALYGVDQLTKIYIGLTRKQLNEGNLKIASVYLDRGLIIAPTNTDMLKVGEEVAEYKNSLNSESKLLSNDDDFRRDLIALEEEFNTEVAIVESIALCPTPANWSDVWKIVSGEYCPSSMAELHARAETENTRR